MPDPPRQMLNKCWGRLIEKRRYLQLIVFFSSAARLKPS